MVADAAFEAKDRPNAIKYCAEAKDRGLTASDGAVAFAEEDVGGAAEDDAQHAPPAEGARGLRCTNDAGPAFCGRRSRTVEKTPYGI